MRGRWWEVAADLRQTVRPDCEIQIRTGANVGNNTLEENVLKSIKLLLRGLNETAIANKYHIQTVKLQTQA